ncbi:MAG: S9 family peptidase [Muribaculaceae bacterium]|nr:S9 family peptidase [Muribaculaceae bacterium]
MNHLKTLLMSTSLLAGTMAAVAADDDNIIERPDFTPVDGQYSIEVLEALGRVGNPVVSPDGKKVLYGVSYESVEQNRSNLDLYVMDVNGANKSRLTRTPKSEQGATWIDGGRRIAFIYPSTDDLPQLWVMDADGTNRRCVSNVEKGIQGFLFSPDQKHVLMIGSVKYSRDAVDVFPDLPKATGRVIDDLMYKHWDEWVTEIPHPLIGDFDGEQVSGVRDIMQDEPFESPMKPFGGIESFAWSPDSRELIYVSRKKTGMDYALSTNSDLYIYDLASGTTRNMTEGMMGYDTCPAYSPDGKWIAWLSMEHDGYESDKNRIMVMDRATGVKTDLTADWDYTVDAICWNPDSKSIYFIAPKDGVTPIFSIDLKKHEVKTVATGVCDYAALAPVDAKTLLTVRHSMLAPNEIFSIDAKGRITQLTDVNSALLAQVKMPTVEARMVPTTDGKQMLTWVVYPPEFDASKTYPSILYCQGGPQSAVSQFFSYRWNLALMAANGYIVIAPNRRGLPGFGTEWNAQISGDYPGQNMKDYLSAVDDMKKESYIDPDRIGAVGASYGGFSVYWLAGNHDNRFKCFIAHAGIFNTEAQYLETEEMWFANWDLGGPFWDKNNPVAARTFASSPHKFVDRWNTPILVTHGEYDFRILASQGMMAFNAARLRGVPAEMLIFPDENHWILKPQNAVMWQRVFFRWLDRWLKDQK